MRLVVGEGGSILYAKTKQTKKNPNLKHLPCTLGNPQNLKKNC